MWKQRHVWVVCYVGRLPECQRHDRVRVGCLAASAAEKLVLLPEMLLRPNKRPKFKAHARHPMRHMRQVHAQSFQLQTMRLRPML